MLIGISLIKEKVASVTNNFVPKVVKNLQRISPRGGLVQLQQLYSTF